MISAPRRIPAGPDLDVLMRLYGYRFTRTGGVAGAETSNEAADVALAESAGWPVRSVERFTPAEAFERSIHAVAALDEDAVLGAFVSGLGSAPHGRQTLISFAWARHLASAPRTADGLPDCGLDARHAGGFEVDPTEVLLRLALGWAWNEQPERYLLDLETAASAGLPAPTAEDRERLRALIDVISAQPDGTRASELEKAVARAKVVPGTDKYQRYGILIGLAEYGLLPSTLAPGWDRFVSRTEFSDAWSGGPRSDITPPLSGWRGGVDGQRAARLLTV
ncbi:hypothetical protein [Streptomyces sp. AC495_CC817]|uniref:hypothetical protein n=1 Tax=Streptomyces sp. AC495_CC817 TaxID=2823900 RepID=UPI001C278A7E|nr:hypothetical protein [Streptomyces sp. AC495_CC817]